MPSLPTRPLGPSGIEVSVVGLGCNNFGRRLDVSGTRRVVDAALEAGVTHLDTADRYGDTKSEQFLGEVLKGRRDRVVLATKFGLDVGDGYTGHRGSADYVRRAVAASLKRLQTDVIDLYWYHRPDGVTPIEETLGALHALVQAGTVRAIGVSNFSAAQLEQADSVARVNGLTPFSAVQNEYSLLKRGAEADVIPACERLGVAFIPYYPLASGLLTGKYRRGAAAPSGARLSERTEIATDAQWQQVEALMQLAASEGVSLTELAIGALLDRSPAVASVIAGATKPEQVQANAAGGRYVPSAAARSALADGHL
jgi:aryl-alcohol dehydrogenase-like predicted oxidoreductase